MLVYYFVPFIVNNLNHLFWDSNGHNSVTVQNRTHIYINFFHHKDLGNHLLQLCPKVVNHLVYPTYKESFQVSWDNSIRLFLHAAIYLEVSLFCWTSQNVFSREKAVYKWYCVQCCMQHCTQFLREQENAGNWMKKH
jgi:hypothetical protein